MSALGSCTCLCVCTRASVHSVSHFVAIWWVITFTAKHLLNVLLKDRIVVLLNGSLE